MPYTLLPGANPAPPLALPFVLDFNFRASTPHSRSSSHSQTSRPLPNINSTLHPRILPPPLFNSDLSTNRPQQPNFRSNRHLPNPTMSAYSTQEYSGIFNIPPPSTPVMQFSVPPRRPSRPNHVPIIDLTLPSPPRASSVHGIHKRHKSHRNRSTPKLSDLLSNEVVASEVNSTAIKLEPDVKITSPQPEQKARTIADVTCVICMEDAVVDLSTTPCGHLFCHKCAWDAISASMEMTNKRYGVCPICRHRVGLKEIVRLQFKIGSNKGKEKAETPTSSD